MRRAELTDGEHGEIISILTDLKNDMRTLPWRDALGREEASRRELNYFHLIELLNRAETF
jgi:hypothetical protein